MRSQLAFHATNQFGLITREQVLAAGLSEGEIRRLTRPDGAWVVVRRGVYVRREVWEAASNRSGRPLLRTVAAHLKIGHSHVVSHTAAGLLHGLPMLRPKDTNVHTTRRGVGGSRTRHGVKHHLAEHAAHQVVDIGGVPTLDLARTAVDIGREHGYLHGLVACDAARQSGVSLHELRTAVAPMANWPYVIAARAGVEDSDGGAESVGETLARDFLSGLGLGPVTTQFSVAAGGSVHFVDLRVGRHLVEFDGRVKYQRRDQGGVADRPPQDVVWAEKRRQDDICAEGYGMSRLVWDDIWTESARRDSGARIIAEFARTTQRHGTDLPAGYQPIPRIRHRAS